MVPDGIGDVLRPPEDVSEDGEGRVLDHDGHRVLQREVGGRLAAVQHSTVQYSTVQYSTVQYSTWPQYSG